MIDNSMMFYLRRVKELRFVTLFLGLLAPKLAVFVLVALLLEVLIHTLED